MKSNHFQPKSILVTGGAGFIGSNFIHYLISKDPTVTIVNLDALTYAGSLKNLEGIAESSRYHFVQGNICDQNLLKKILIDYNIDTIVHFAAESHVDRSISGPAAFIQTNIVGTFCLLEAAKECWLHLKKWTSQDCRFHHVSTDEVYGSLDANAAPFTEQTAYSPNSPYSASKASSDHLVRAYFHTYGLPVTISQCSNNYGPYQHAEKLIPTVIKACFESRVIPVYGDGTNIRDWLYVEDHCSGIAAILKHGCLGETYNIGGNNELSNLDVVQYICQSMDNLYPRPKQYQLLIQFVTDRAGHDWRYAIDGTKMLKELNWKAKVSFQRGMEQTIAFYSSYYSVKRAIPS